MTYFSSPLYGGIEGGGTKFICAVGTGPNHILAETRFPTTTPQETMSQVVDFFKQQESSFGRIASIGFACFGPLDPNSCVAYLWAYPPDSQTPLGRRKCCRHVAYFF